MNEPPPEEQQFVIGTVDCARANQSNLDAQIARLSEPWSGSLPFEVRIMEDKYVTHKEDVSDLELQTVDIVNYLNGQKYPCHKLYFSLEEYPPPTTSPSCTDLTEVSSWIDLKKALLQAAHHAGNPLISHGKGGCKEGRVFRCICWRSVVTKGDSAPTPSDEPTTEYRTTSMISNDKSNRRVNGRTLPRKRKVIPTVLKCPFQFNVSWDKSGYFVVLRSKSGEPLHKHHAQIFDPKNIPLHTRLLTDHQLESISNMVDSTCNKAHARNYMFTKFRTFISHVKMSFLHRKQNTPDLDTSDEISRMLANFEDSNEIRYTSLSDIPMSDLRVDSRSSPLAGNTSTSHLGDDSGGSTTEGTMTISTTQDDDGNLVNTPVTDLPMMSEIEGVAHNARRTRKLASSVYLFMAVAWISLPAFRFFMLCPEVMWFDVTSHSNNKGYCLLTFSCRTSIDKQVVFMWVWIPNEQRYSFRWVFQVALRKLVPQYLRERVKFIMKDGDPQARNELLVSLKSVFPNAKEGDRGWHILHQGMKTHVPGTKCVSNQKK